MISWNSSPHPISDLRDWSEAGRLELRPPFQRREVWSDPARIMLMDTILRGIPMPKIFLANSIRDGKTYRVVIDGQQRITAILDFLRDRFTLRDPYVGDEKGQSFSDLSQETQDRFLSYQIDFNEAQKPTDEDVREVYARVNKYTVPLTKQELRRADFPGDFLNVSERLALDVYFDHAAIFSTANRRRYADVEYISELLAAMIDGIQDKKTSLDDFYTKYAKWKKPDRDAITARFSNVLNDLKFIFDDPLNLADTRFRQKADFYTLFLAIDEFVSDGRTTKGKSIEYLRQDLQILDENIRPESESYICREYAIKCVSQANTASSRRWRHQFLKSILAGTYIDDQPDDARVRLFYALMDDLYSGGSMCPEPVVECEVCDGDISGEFDDCVLAWRRSDTVTQLSNADWVHSSCVDEQSDLVFWSRPKR